MVNSPALPVHPTSGRVSIPTIGLMGATYFGIVFSFAFATGIVRVLWIAPRLGDAAALLIEIPTVVAASWMVARWLLRDRTIPVGQCAAMGAVAFLLMMASETALSYVMNGQSPAEWGATLSTPLGCAGLAAQLVFAAMPVLIIRYG